MDRQAVLQWAPLIVGTLLGVWGIVATLRSRPRRRLLFSVPIHRALLSRDILAKDVDFVAAVGDWSGKVWMSEIEIRNDGNTVLSPKDFAQPLGIAFPSATHLVILRSARRRNDIPYEAIKERLADSGHRVVIRTDAIEPGDEFALLALHVSENADPPQALGRLIHGRVSNGYFGGAEMLPDAATPLRRRTWDATFHLILLFTLAPAALCAGAWVLAMRLMGVRTSSGLLPGLVVVLPAVAIAAAVIVFLAPRVVESLRTSAQELSQWRVTAGGRDTAIGQASKVDST